MQILTYIKVLIEIYQYLPKLNAILKKILKKLCSIPKKKKKNYNKIIIKLIIK